MLLRDWSALLRQFEIRNAILEAFREQESGTFKAAESNRARATRTTDRRVSVSGQNHGRRRDTL